MDPPTDEYSKPFDLYSQTIDYPSINHSMIMDG